MAARQLSAKKPKDLRYTVGTLLSYMGRHRFLLLAVAVLVSLSALANLLGTYMIRPRNRLGMIWGCPEALRKNRCRF